MNYRHDVVSTALHSIRRSSVALAVVSTMASYALPAQAQQPNQNVRSLEEVVVTARRREESVQVVPISVTTFDSSTLDTFQIGDLNSLQFFDPSFSVSPTAGRPNKPIYSLRGIRPNEAIFGQDPTVAIYLADVVLSPANGSNQSMYDLESVQVLKGPQGTLFGRNTIGGAILLTPKRPGDVFGGDLMVGFGNYGRQEAQFGVDLPVNENFALRLSGRLTDNDGYQTNVAPGPLYGSKRGGGKTRSGRLSAVWNMTDTVENHTILTWDQMRLNGRTGVLQAINPDTPLGLFNGGPPLNLPSLVDALERAQGRSVHEIESDMRERSDVEVWGIINTTTVDISDDLTFRSILAYRDLNGKDILDLDATAIPGLLTSDPSEVSFEHASIELQFLGTALNDRLDWVAGLYWYYEEGGEYSPGAVLGPINPDSPFTQQSYMENHSYSAFAQGAWRFSDEWSVTAGLRWNYDRKKLDASSKTPTACDMFDETGTALPFENCWFYMSESFSQPTGTVSLEYTPLESTMIYLASRYGYRSGGFNARATQPVEREPFDEETVLDLELGVKADWFVGDWRMRSNVAVYHQWYDDIQRTVAVQSQAGAPGSSVENAAKATIFGLEVEQIVSPTENLSLKFQYAYTDPQYDDWVDPLTGVDLSGTPFHYTPRHALTTTLMYSYPVAGGDMGVLDFAVSASWQDAVWINSLQNREAIDATPSEIHHTMRQEAYWLVNLSAEWDQIMGSDLSVSAYVNNATNEDYAVGGIHLYPTLGLVTKVYAEPRTYGLQLRYRF